MKLSVTIAAYEVPMRLIKRCSRFANPETGPVGLDRG